METLPEKDCLVLAPGGKLLRSKWSSDERRYLHTDVTVEAYKYLNENCEVDSATRVADVFALIEQNDVFKLIYENDFVEDYLAAYLAWNASTPAAPEENASAELYWVAHIETGRGDYMVKAVVNAQERLKKQDPPKKEGIVKSIYDHLADGKTPQEYFDSNAYVTFAMPHFHLNKGGEFYSMACTPIEQILPLPLVLSKEMVVTRDYKRSFMIKNPCFTLNNILAGVLYEVSFHGGPGESAKFAEYLSELVEDVRAGRAELVDFDDKLLEDDRE